MGLVSINLRLLPIELIEETLEQACERILKKRAEDMPLIEGASASENIVADIDNYYVADGVLYKIQNLEVEEFGGYATVEEDATDEGILNFTAVCDDEEESIEELITYALYGTGEEE